LGGEPKIYCSALCRRRAGTRRQRGLPVNQPLGHRRRATRRRELPEAASDAGWQLRKAVERIGRIMADDRLPANRGKVAVHLGGHLQYAADACARALSQLREEGQPDDARS
jgi:hypothetical protein